ncbi:histidine kinase dimerization/phospho-acceptor domain-containing protein [Altererythrobacter lauratis]|uniref:histidine kinase n=1 Tax=Alteraurantiacibacter lauratis TaxID=2054627 RepID=A0ABV7EIN4_9SPHN
MSMQVDDRLATVLRAPPSGDRAARTQYRQVIDLLGSRPAAPGDMSPAQYRSLAARVELVPADEWQRRVIEPALAGHNPHLLAYLGWRRLDELARLIPDAERARILREPGQRLRNRHLVAHLAVGDVRSAAAAMAIAQLDEAEWLDLVPRLPVMARGFLRHRRDLPPSVARLLGSLGVTDMTLPAPDGTPVPGEIAPHTEAPAQAPTPAPAPGPGTFPPAERDGIRALLHRIEAFREGRLRSAEESRLPLGDLEGEDGGPASTSGNPMIDRFDFRTGVDGRIAAADADIAPLLVGMLLSREGPGVLAVLDQGAASAFDLRQPLRAARLEIDAASAVSGTWRIDAEPEFTPVTGHFAGYRGRARRWQEPLPLAAAPPATADLSPDSGEDRIRQTLHELRTPVNAIQGFAEVIQQQVFGPAPNAYRALAAGIAVDAAKLLAAFEEVDRLARLESGALALAQGDADLHEAVAETLRRLEGVLRPRGAAIALQATGDAFPTPLAREELLLLVWRILATLAGAVAPGEHLHAQLEPTAQPSSPAVTLTCNLPRSIAAQDDPFAPMRKDKSQLLSATMFGTGFALRLARAEAEAAGGSLEICADNLALTLPLLTAPEQAHSTAERGEDAA